MLRRTPTVPQIRSARRSLSQHALLTLIRALVVSKVDYCCSVLTGVSSHLLSSLSINTAARLIYARRSEHVTPLFHDLHWLRGPERIQFRLRVLTFRCFHGFALSYLANSHRRTFDVAGRQCLRSSDVTCTLVVPSTRRSTFGDRAFPVAAPRTWNRLPASVRAATSLSTFRRELPLWLLRTSSTCFT